MLCHVDTFIFPTGDVLDKTPQVVDLIEEEVNELDDNNRSNKGNETLRNNIKTGNNATMKKGGSAKKAKIHCVEMSDKENSSPHTTAKVHSSNKAGNDSSRLNDTVDPQEKQMFMNGNWWDKDNSTNEISDDEMFPITSGKRNDKAGDSSQNSNKTGPSLRSESDNEDLSYLHTLDESNDSSNNDYSFDRLDSDSEDNSFWNTSNFKNIQGNSMNTVSLNLNTNKTEGNSIALFDDQVTDANLLDTDLLNSNTDLMDIDTSLLDNETSLLDIEKGIGNDGE